MKFYIKSSILAVFLALPIFAYGQGSGSSDTPKTSGGKATKTSNFAISRSSSGIIVSISASSIGIKTSSGKTIIFSINRDTKFTGIRPGKGERAKITYLASGKQAVLIRRN